jgi:CBS domain-containing protein
VAIGEICNREVVFARPNESVRSAALLMREHHVGSLVVVDEAGGRPIPAGILTDRDIAVGVVALGLDPEATLVGAVMSPEVIVEREDAGVAETVALMRQKGLRRLPVVDRAGSLVGVVSADDLLELLAEELTGLASMVAREQRRETEQRRALP